MNRVKFSRVVDMKKTGARGSGIRFSAVALSVAQLFWVASVYAQETPSKHMYHLPSATLESTLLEIGKAGGQPISFDAALVSKLRAAPLEGNFTAAEAVDHALLGTDLERITNPDGSLAVRHKSNSTPNAQAVSADLPSATLPLISVAAQADSGGNGFVSDSSSSYARTDTPLSETPKSVQVINAAVIQSQGDQSLADILRNSSGVVTQPGPLGVPQFVVRGFAAPVLSDGQVTVGSAPSLTPTIAISSVEVLKGPSAILAGDSPPGGVVNIVTKTPQAEAFHEIQLGYGTYGDKQAAIDSTGSIGGNSHLLYRFILSDEHSGQNGMGYNGLKHLFFSPTIEWKDANTDLLLNYTHTVTHDPIPQFTLGYDTGDIYRHYIDHPLGNVNDGFDTNSDAVSLKLEQKLNSNITFVSHTTYTKDHELQQAWTPVSNLSSVGNSLPILSFQTLYDYYSWSLEDYVKAKYTIGDLKTTTLVGWDLLRYQATQNQTNNVNFDMIQNIFSSFTIPTAAGGGPYSPINYLSTQSGLFIQEQFNYNRLHGLVSVRRDQYEDSDAIPGFGYDSTHQAANSPSVGLMYQITSDIAAYGNYNSSFVPGTAQIYGGGILPPERSKQAEVGLKANFLGDKLSVTTSAYRISYSNQNVSDPIHPGFSLAAGGAVSRGFELDIAGEVAKGLNIIGNYTYNDYVQPYNPTVKVSLPKNSASLWTTYNIPSDKFPGFGVGLGLFYAGDQYIGTTSEYKIPNQVETDIGIFYKRKNYSLNLSVKNVFDRNLYYSSTDSSYIPMGPGRTMLLTGTYDF